MVINYELIAQDPATEQEPACCIHHMEHLNTDVYAQKAHRPMQRLRLG